MIALAGGTAVSDGDIEELELVGELCVELLATLASDEPPPPPPQADSAMLATRTVVTNPYFNRFMLDQRQQNN
jgi:hypothetical protein